MAARRIICNVGHGNEEYTSRGLFDMDAGLRQHYSCVRGARQVHEPEEIQRTVYCVDRLEDKRFTVRISVCTRYELSYDEDYTCAVR